MLQAEADTLVGDDTAGMIIKEAGELLIVWQASGVNDLQRRGDCSP